MEYVCADCGRKLLETGKPLATDVTAHCKRCGEVVEAVPGGEVMHRTYHCTNDGCEVTIHAERHAPDWTFCAACGTETLEVTREVRRPTRTRVARQTVSR